MTCRGSYNPEHFIATPPEVLVRAVLKEGTMTTMTPTTYEELHRKTVAELREIAKGLNHEALQGYTQMNKEHLLPALCKALGIETHAHHHLTSGFDKVSIKAKMHDLKSNRAAALQAGDAERLHMLRRHLHRLNRRIRAHTV